MAAQGPTKPMGQKEFMGPRLNPLVRGWGTQEPLAGLNRVKNPKHYCSHTLQGGEVVSHLVTYHGAPGFGSRSSGGI